MIRDDFKISACLVVYHEEEVIERCLQSITGLVDEIVVVHDGPCNDRTLEIAERYTDKIFIQNHVGIAEPHRVFALSKTSGTWILQMDADEFLDMGDHEKIRSFIRSAPSSVDAFIFKWEMWSGKSAVYFPGLQKMCLFKKKEFFFCGVPQEIGDVRGEKKLLDIVLHHKPTYSNISWKEFMRKSKKWTIVHASYFFPEDVAIVCFNTSPDQWIAYTKKVRSRIWYHLLVEPLRMSLGQLKNGLWRNRYGWQVVLERAVYYGMLYWQIKRRMSSRKT